MERDPHQVIEGVIIASYAVGARRAYVYIRGEFFLGVKRWIKAIADAYEHGFLGKNILGSGFDLDLEVKTVDSVRANFPSTPLDSYLERRKKQQAKIREWMEENPDKRLILHPNDWEFICRPVKCWR